MERRFDEWGHTVDCNDCEHYWSNACDGVSEAQKRSCTAFKATRSVVIPLQINALRTRLKWLTAGVITLGILQVIMLIVISI